MKKYFYLSAAALATLFATSCSSEDVPAPVDGDMTTFEVQLPDQLTTRFGEGQQATKLYVAVYEQGTKNLLFSNFAGTGNDKNAASLSITPFTTGEKPTCKVSVPLVKGKAYDLVFFAQDEDSEAYSFSTADQTMTVSYADMANFDEARDTFFGQIKNFTSGGQGDSVTLTRPFAQINIGTADYQKYLNASGLTAQTFGMKVSGVANTLDLLSGTVEEPATNDAAATVALAGPTPDGTKLTVNGAAYDYLAMGYVLVGGNATTQATLNVDLYVGDETKAFATYPSVPAQMNYRTNIFGDLLTNLENFNVTIDPNFNKQENNVAVWDGKTVTAPVETADAWVVSTPGQWVALRSMDLHGKTVKLAANLDFGGHDVKGMGFVGTFDGQGHIMSNMVILPGGSSYSNGLFQGDASFGGSTIKNITFANVTVNSVVDPDNGIAGTVFGDIQQGDVTLSNVHLINGNIRGIKGVGGLVGFVATGRTLTVENCSVEASNISNISVPNESGYVAGLVGRPVGKVVVTNSTVTNTVIDAFYAAKRGEASIQPLVGDMPDLLGGEGVTVTRKPID